MLFISAVFLFSCKTGVFAFIPEEGDTYETKQIVVVPAKSRIFAGDKLIYEDLLIKEPNDTIWDHRMSIYNFKYKEGYEYSLLVKKWHIKNP